MRRLQFALLLALLTAALACASSFPGIEPVYPSVTASLGKPTVDSLQPTLKWEYKEDMSHTYDLVIHNVFVDPKDSRHKVLGDVVYYRENLERTEHTIEKPLEPGREYCWSVRPRKYNKVGSWSRYNQTAFVGVAILSKRNAYFTFRTPETPVTE